MTDAIPETKNPQQPSIQIHTQYVKDLSFENPNSPFSLSAEWGQPQTHMQINVRTQKVEENRYEVLLLFRIEAKNPKLDKATFLIDLAYGAFVTLSMPAEHHEPALMVEVPRLLYPFARQVIAEAATNGGFPAILLQPIHFDQVYLHQKQQQQQAKAATQTESGDKKAAGNGGKN